MSDDTIIVPANPDTLRRESAGDLRISNGYKPLEIGWSKSTDAIARDSHLTVEGCKFCGEPLWPGPHAIFLVTSAAGNFKICILAVIRRLATMPEWQDLIEFTPKVKP